MADTSTERRKSQRVEASLKLEVKLPSGEEGSTPASLETINISSSGIYFRSEHYIEPMTKLAMMLELRVPAAEEGGEMEVDTVPCEGIVVRVTPEKDQLEVEKYEVAVFFTNIEPRGVKALESHVALLMNMN